MEFAGISVVVLETARAVSIRAQVELAAVAKDHPDALVSFVTGSTFQSFFTDIERDAVSGRMDLSAIRVTHADEFLGFGPDDPGGFAHELLGCAPLTQAHREGRFVPVPSSEPEIRGHEVRLGELGGVKLQFLGLGENGHIAYSEPGTALDVGFHRARLAPTTRQNLRSRFAPHSSEVPAEVITAGPRNVLEAGRLVVVATGAEKARAVRDMMEGDIGSACPASVIQRHPDVLVLLDKQAATGLDWPETQAAAAQ